MWSNDKGIRQINRATVYASITPRSGEEVLWGPKEVNSDMYPTTMRSRGGEGWKGKEGEGVAGYDN